MNHRLAARIPLVLCLLLLGGCAPPAEKPGTNRALEAIDAATLEQIVRALSDDAMQGRGPATEGDRRARAYLTGYMRDLGLEPGMPDGSWEQPIELVGITTHPPQTWNFEDAAGQELTLKPWDEFIATSGVQRESVAIDDAEIVFVGYGITAPEENWDDFKGADLTGKILLMMNNDPDWDPELFAGKRRLLYGRWTYKYESAARQGAAGAIIIHTDDSAGYPFKVVQTSWTGEQFELPAGDEPRIRVAAWTTEDAARRLAALGGHDLDALREAARRRDFKPVPLGVTTTLHFENTLHPGSMTANVLGLLRGRDPELRDELVVYTAHHDHLGVGQPDESGDRIYNGARDNASGVATVLAVARAFRALPEPPRRSVLFLLVGAEEQGLLGSAYYAAHPTVHPGKIVADLNFDSAAVFGPARDVAVIGRGKSGLEDLLEQAAARQERVVVDEPFPDKGYYYRSDQFNFAKIGVPALYFKGGTDIPGHPEGWGRQVEDTWRDTRYHQPSDEIYEEWNFDGMAQDARLAFSVGLEVAEMDSPPGWRPGDEFEAVRRRMQAEAAGEGTLNPDAPPETAQFAFLIGKWDCKTRFMNPQGEYGEGRATWTGYYILDGWAIQDDWVPLASGGKGLQGTNIRSFNPKTKKWDNRWLPAGSLQWVYYEAEQVGETMVMTGGEGRDPRGAYVDRNTFYEIAENGWRWRKDRSYDGGKSWIEGIGYIEARRAP